MSKFLDFVFDNGYQVDATTAEANMRRKYPLLLHDNEKVELAFKDRGGKGRDKEYFTTHRILVKDGKGVGSKRKNYLSIPYDKILAFSVQTAGSLVDRDCELRVWSTAGQMVAVDFATSNVDVFQIYLYLNT